MIEHTGKPHCIPHNCQKVGGAAGIGAKSYKNEGVRAPFASDAMRHAVRVVSAVVFACSNKCAVNVMKNVKSTKIIFFISSLYVVISPR